MVASLPHVLCVFDLENCRCQTVMLYDYIYFINSI